MLSDLSFCRPRVSCVIEASIDDVWNVVRDWSRFAWVNKVDDNPLEISLVEGSATAVGSLRAVRIGPSQYFERLVGLDDEDHVMKWRIVSHPDSVSPFPEAPFINFSCQLSLDDVTHGNLSFAEFKGSFYTEHEHAESMNARLEHWFETALQGLQDYMAQRSSRSSAHGSGDFGQQQRVGQSGSSADNVSASGQPGERPFPVPPQGPAFQIPNGRAQQPMEEFGASPRGFPEHPQRPLGHTKPMGQTTGPYMPPHSTDMQSTQTVVRQDAQNAQNLWTKMPSIGVGTSSQAADTQRWTQMPSPNRGPNPSNNQPQARNQWPPPPQNNQWPYQ